MDRILLVRHGESEHHVRGLTGGWTDLPLTEQGRRQASRTAQRVGALLAGAPVSLFASDLSRAVMTAEPIGRVLDVPVRAMPGLRELNNGVAAGLSQAAAQKLRLPQGNSPFDWQPYPEAETWRGMTARVVSTMEEIASCSAATAVVVSHGNAGTSVVRWWLGLTDLDRHKISFELDCCSLTDLTTNAWGEPTISRLNDVSHL